MPSRTRKTQAGKLLMLLSFLHVISALIFIPNPLTIIISAGLSVAGLSTATAEMAASGALGLVIFFAGYELWDRNRETWQEA